MSLLEHLRLVKIEKDFLKGIGGIKTVIRDEEELKKRLEDIHDDADVRFIEDKDISILNRLGKKDRAKLKETLKLVEKLAKERSDQDIISRLEQIFEHLDVTEKLELKEEEEILAEFRELAGSIRDDGDIEDFFSRHPNFFGAKPHKRLKKRIRKFLQKRIEEQGISEEGAEKGPTIRKSELRALKRSLEVYFGSDDFTGYMRRFFRGAIDVKVGLFGSMVTGTASAESRFKGLPTDKGRVSDVDIGIIVPHDLITRIPLEGRHIRKRGLYYGPYFRSNAEKSGPFQNIFRYLENISYAGRRDRKIGVVIVDKDFYRHNLSDEDHMILVHHVTDIS